MSESRARGSRETTQFVNNKLSPLLAAYAGKCILVTGAERRDQRLLRVRGPKMTAQQSADSEFEALLPMLEQAVELRRLGLAMEVLRKLVPEFRPSELLLGTLQQASVAKA